MFPPHHTPISFRCEHWPALEGQIIWWCWTRGNTRHAHGSQSQLAMGPLYTPSGKSGSRSLRLSWECSTTWWVVREDGEVDVLQGRGSVCILLNSFNTSKDYQGKLCCLGSLNLRELGLKSPCIWCVLSQNTVISYLYSDFNSLTPVVACLPVSQGYRTGYPYRCPSLRDKAKKYSDVESASSAHGGYSYGEDSDSGARSPLKHSFQRGQRDKTRWVNAGGRPDEPYEDGPDGSSPKSKPKVWTNITHDHVKPLLQSLSSGVCVPSCITNCLVCAYLIVHSIDFTATLLVETGRWSASWGSGDS